MMTIYSHLGRSAIGHLNMNKISEKDLKTKLYVKKAKTSDIFNFLNYECLDSAVRIPPMTIVFRST